MVLIVSGVVILLVVIVETAATAGLASSETPDNVTSLPEVITADNQQKVYQGLGARRADCSVAVNQSQAEEGVTCDTDLLVHYSLMDFWANHASPAACQKREVVGETLECLLKATEQCLPPDDLLGLPDASRARQGLHYICNVYESQLWDVDMACAQRHLRQVFECLERDAKDMHALLAVDPASLHSPSDLNFVCRTYDIAELCNWEELQLCGTDTAAVYTRLMAVHLRPPSCLSSAAIMTSMTVSCFLLSLLALLLA